MTKMRETQKIKCHETWQENIFNTYKKFLLAPKILQINRFKFLDF